MSECRDFHFLLIKSYGLFPDLPIVFRENSENNRIGNIVRKIFRTSKFKDDHEILRFPFFAVFGTLFSIDN